MKFVWDLNRTFDLGSVSVDEWKKHSTFSVLLETNKRYRDWLEKNPDKKDHYIFREDGEVPTEIIDMLETICSATTNIDDACVLTSPSEEWENFEKRYPGIPYSPETIAYKTCIAGVLFNTEFDINNPDENILPSFKHVSAYFDLPLTMSAEQLQEEEQSSNAWNPLAASNVLIVGIARCASSGYSMSRVKNEN